MCAIVGKPLMSAYMHEKNLGQLPVLTSLAMTSAAILCSWYVVSPWTCHRADHPSSSSSPHLGQVSVSVSVSASKYRYRYRYRFLVSVTALITTIFRPKITLSRMTTSFFRTTPLGLGLDLVSVLYTVA